MSGIIIKLNKLKFKEINKDITEFETEEIFLNEFNLLIGDNAQGKTRLLRAIKFLSTLVTNSPKYIETKFEASFIFDVLENENSYKINYELIIYPDNGKNKYEERIYKEDELILSTINDKKLLYNEEKKQVIKDFFIPQNIPSITSITGKDFKTIKLLNNFFSRIVLISASKSRIIDINKDAIIPDEEGRNIPFVLYNWKNKKEPLYNELINEFKKCFSFVKDINFIPTPIKGQGLDIIADIPFVLEDNVDDKIQIFKWSDGFYRTLHLLMSPKIQFSIDEIEYSPSLILIDEIENGLDFKTLKYIIQYFKDYSDDSQIITTSHSPLVCEFINPENWLVVKRNGPIIKFKRPKDIEDNLDFQLEMFKQDHWEFYSKHINNSEIYIK